MLAGACTVTLACGLVTAQMVVAFCSAEVVYVFDALVVVVVDLATIFDCTCVFSLVSCGLEFLLGWVSAGLEAPLGWVSAGLETPLGWVSAGLEAPLGWVSGGKPSCASFLPVPPAYQRNIKIIFVGRKEGRNICQSQMGHF